MCPQPSFRATLLLQQCLFEAYQSDNIFILPRLRCGKHETTNYKFVKVLDRDKLVSVLTHQACCYITVEHVVP